jgi:hypothetical protein
MKIMSAMFMSVDADMWTRVLTTSGASRHRAAVSTHTCIERSCVTRLLYAPTACLELGRQEREVAMYSTGPTGVEVPLVCVVRQSAREQRSPCWRAVLEHVMLQGGRE